MPAYVPDADLIFVLAGLEARKVYGLQLLRQERARGILLSVGRYEIWRLSNLDLPVPIDLLEIAAPIPPPLRHYFVFFRGATVHTEQITLGRFGTWSEIHNLASWLRKHSEARSVLIISSGSHLPRIRLCSRALLPPEWNVQFLPSPDPEPQTSRKFWSRQLESGKAKLIEYLKLLLYQVVVRLPQRDVRAWK